MIKTQRLPQLFAAGALAVAMAMGATSVSAQDSGRRPITLLCGPTFRWSCSAIGGPEFLFIGTICDKIRYERKTGRVCRPI